MVLSEDLHTYSFAQLLRLCYNPNLRSFKTHRKDDFLMRDKQWGWTHPDTV